MDKNHKTMRPYVEPRISDEELDRYYSTTDRYSFEDPSEAVEDAVRSIRINTSNKY